MSTHRLIPVTALTAFVLSSSVAWAQEFISEFQASFDGWQQQWHKESSTGTDGVATHSTERGYLDGASLKFDMGDGFGDDGTLWIEKQLAVSSTQPTHVSVNFQLFNLEQSDFNTFQVKAAIGTDDPNEQIDFTTIGSTDTAQGWVPFTYDATIPPSASPVWVAVGIRVAWETPRDYWIDRVVVSTTIVPEPTSGRLFFGCLAGLALLRAVDRANSSRLRLSGERTAMDFCQQGFRC